MTVTATTAIAMMTSFTSATVAAHAVYFDPKSDEVEKRIARVCLWMFPVLNGIMCMGFNVLNMIGPGKVLQ